MLGGGEAVFEPEELGDSAAIVAGIVRTPVFVVCDVPFVSEGKLELVLIDCVRVCEPEGVVSPDDARLDAYEPESPLVAGNSEALVEPDGVIWPEGTSVIDGILEVDEPREEAISVLRTEVEPNGDETLKTKLDKLDPAGSPLVGEAVFPERTDSDSEFVAGPEIRFSDCEFVGEFSGGFVSEIVSEFVGKFFAGPCEFIVESIWRFVNDCNGELVVTEGLVPKGVEDVPESILLIEPEMNVLSGIDVPNSEEMIEDGVFAEDSVAVSEASNIVLKLKVLVVGEIAVTGRITNDREPVFAADLATSVVVVESDATKLDSVSR